MVNDFVNIACEGKLECPIVALNVAKSRKGIQYLGAQLGHPVTGRHKFSDLILQVWGSTQS
jgi:hypothetical protein